MTEENYKYRKVHFCCETNLKARENCKFQLSQGFNQKKMILPI